MSQDHSQAVTNCEGAGDLSAEIASNTKLNGAKALISTEAEKMPDDTSKDLVASTQAKQVCGTDGRAHCKSGSRKAV